MSATSVTKELVTKNRHDFYYADYYGRSTDPKPTTGVFNGSTFLESVYSGNTFQGKWRIYIFDGDGMEWLPMSEWDAPSISNNL